MKRIPLTQGKYALVDDEDYDRLVAMGKWCASKMRNTFYAVKAARPRNISMHSVLFMETNKKYRVDHIDGNGLNNQKCNLRICTNAENARNQRIKSNNTSGFKGVHLYKGLKKWGAGIKINGKRIHLGTFDTPIEAARAYNAAAIKYHGEFAKLNEIPA